MNWAELLNRLLVLRYRRAARAFEAGLDQVAARQQQVLLDILHKNRESAWGKRWGFEQLSTPEDFQRRLPLTVYEDYRAEIEALQQVASPQLTQEPVLLFELTSGSTGGAKYIPYTQSLKSEFQRGLKPWLHDLYTRHPRLLAGKSYWSITPVLFEKQVTPSGIPIGFEEDSAYFGRLEAWIMDRLFAVPGELKFVSDLENFRYITLAFLLKEADLSLISIWNPSFLLILLEKLEQYKKELLRDLQEGRLGPPCPMEGELLDRLTRQLKVKKKRLAVLKGVLEAEPLNYEAIWPRLTLISTWADGNAAVYLPRLQAAFPHAVIQPKGLLATECLVSFPYQSDQVGALSYLSHFYEFLPHDLETGETGEQARMAHELEAGQVYNVVVTTGGGFYRYQMQDLVQVVGFLKELPLLRFLGKANLISDMVGEKLHEGFVKAQVEDLAAAQGLTFDFYLLAPEQDAQGSFYYILYVQYRQGQAPDPVALAAELDQKLKQSFHYQYARDLGQLKALALFLIDEGERPEEAYLNHLNRQGQRLGNIKPKALENSPGWRKAFRGHLVNVPLGGNGVNSRGLDTSGFFVRSREQEGSE